MKNLFHKMKKLLFKKDAEKGTNARTSKEHSLERFVEIQELMFERALSEVKRPPIGYGSYFRNSKDWARVLRHTILE